jgi:maltose-binding protein MalE
MRNAWPVRTLGLLVGLAVVAASPLAGCGSGSSTTVQVSPEFEKKTQDMLKNMKKDYQAKYAQKALEAKKARKQR